MTISITHTFVSGVADDPADVTAGKVVPSEWNAEHTLSGFGTGVAAALAVNVGSAGSPVLNGGAIGTPTSGDFSSGTFTWPTFNQNTSGSAATLTTGRTIYGNSFNGSANLTQVIASTFGGTGNGFAKLSGPTTSEKTFTLPDASAVILTDNAAVTVAQGGTGRATGTTAYGLIAAGTTATGAQQTVGTGTTSQVLVGAGSSALPAFGSVPAGAMPALTGDVTTSAGAVATTLATVNSNVGTFGSATKTVTVSTNGKGLTTAISEQTVTPAVTSITGDMRFNVRLTLESGVPISTSDQTGKTSVFITPYGGQYISLWDGSVWQTVAFSQVTQALGTITSGKPYDVFGYLSSGALASEILVWTNDTTRATAITLTDGIYTKSGDKTRLYLGTFYTTGTTTTEDSEANRYLDSYFNPVLRRASKTDSTSHTYGSATIRQWNNSSANQINFIVGVARFTISAALRQNVQLATSAGVVQAGMQIDDVTSSATYAGFVNNTASVTTAYQASAWLFAAPAAGKHFIAATERSVSGTNTFDSYVINLGLTM